MLEHRSNVKCDHEEPAVQTKLSDLIRDPANLLLIDAMGAAVTSILTLGLLASQLLKSGLPVPLLVAMAGVAACFACFDLVARFRSSNHLLALRVISGLNFGYCLFTLGALYLHRASVTPLGYLYFSIEAVLVAGLATWEMRIGSRG